MSARERAAGLFLAPAPRSPARESARAAAARVVVLGRRADADTVAVPVALALRRRERAAAAVVATLPAGSADSAAPAAAPDGAGATASRAARRLALRLDALGVDAVPRGRIVRATLPAEPGLAVAALERAAGAGAPLVAVLGGVREPAHDPLLAAAELLVLVTREPEGPLAGLARDDLARFAAPVHTLAPLTGAARLAAAHVPPATVRRALREAR